MAAISSKLAMARVAFEHLRRVHTSRCAVSVRRTPDVRDLR